MKVTIPPVKGTRDFYPELMHQRRWLYQKIEAVSKLYGYQEYEAPLIERIDLYAAKSGEELVKEQAFVFSDRGGDLITLRPELTLSLARMVAQKQNQLNYPLRWWSFGPFWRYERPQKGRTREFFQWNIDLIGTKSAEGDAELISIAASFLASVGLKPEHVSIRMNDRNLMESELSLINIDPQRKKDFFRLIDRVKKIKPDAWLQYGLDLGLSKKQMDGLLALLGDRELWRKSPDLVKVMDTLTLEGKNAWLEFDPHVIRGLDYYTGIVFEAMDRTGGRSLLGGGRYDNLVADVGGEPLPGVGFAMGDVMAMIVLDAYQLLPEPCFNLNTVLVTVFDESTQPHSIRLSDRLRRAGINVICYPEPLKLQKQIKYADRGGIRFLIILGPDEIQGGNVTIKDLAHSVQYSFDNNSAEVEITRLLAQDS